MALGPPRPGELASPSRDPAAADAALVALTYVTVLLVTDVVGAVWAGPGAVLAAVVMVVAANHASRTPSDAAAHVLTVCAVAAVASLSRTALPGGVGSVPERVALVGPAVLLGVAVAAWSAGYDARSLALVVGDRTRTAVVAASGVPLGLLVWLAEGRPATAVAHGVLGVVGAVLALTLLGALVEEVLYRGLLLRSLARIWGAGAAAVLATLILVVAHLDAGWWPALAIAATAAVTTRGLRWSGSLLGVIGAHALVNVGVYLIWPGVA
jgi:membrane protease YdiL (CAAX protease family)